MNEANQVFDHRTAREWNELGNAHLKAGAYNDAITAYTKAIEMAPEACWPYIHNLAHVQYQKGKAKGRLAVGQTEDPDLWEGEDESDAATLFDMAAIPSAQRGDAGGNLELEKPSGDEPAVAPPAATPVVEAEADLPPAAPCPAGGGSEPVLQAEEPAPKAAAEAAAADPAPLPPTDLEYTIPSRRPTAAQLVDNTPRNSIDWNELGNTYARSKKYEEAIEAYKKAIEMNPKYGQPYNNLGFVYYHLGKFDVAVLLFKMSIELLDTQDEKITAWNKLGDSYRRLGEYEKALAAYQKSSEIAPPVSPLMARARATLLENSIAG
jgi:tetratricopeptide (TPR) repeat protein